jgi:hypothetical protein
VVESTSISFPQLVQR